MQCVRRSRYLTLVHDRGSPCANSPDTPEALLTEAGRGSHGAFAKLYDLVVAEVYGLVRRVLRDPAQSEEVTQEVMVEVWRTAPRYSEGVASARSWILTIAHRRAVDRVRREQTWRDRTAQVSALDPGESSHEDPTSDAAVHRLVAVADQRRVAQALASLTGVQRQTIELAYFGGHTQTEIAELLGLPLGTVKTRVRDGLIRLRDQLGAPT